MNNGTRTPYSFRQYQSGLTGKLACINLTEGCEFSHRSESVCIFLLTINTTILFLDIHTIQESCSYSHKETQAITYYNFSVMTGKVERDRWRVMACTEWWQKHRDFWSRARDILVDPGINIIMSSTARCGPRLSSQSSSTTLCFW
jgi:hypothetical protein